MSAYIVSTMSNNSGSSRLPLWQLPQQQLQNHQQTNQGNSSNQNQSNQHQSLPLANYTLPGVINYLTSEFTNLERFKIMTNLEKSEMKYRITHLQGEMNSLKYINEQQKLKIQQLEKENSQLKLNKNESKNASTSKDKLENETIEDSLDIPEVDLKLIKDSRYQLTKSMKEVIHLLKSPVNTNIDYLEFPDINESNNAYDEFFNNDRLDNFVFNEYNNQSKGYSKDDNNNYNNDSKATVRKFFDDNDSENLNDTINDKFDKMNIDDEPNLESDTETVQGDVDFKFNNDGEIEPDIDSPNKEEKSPSNPKLEEIYTQSLSDPGLDKVRVFNNPINDVLVYVNYSSNSGPDESKITIIDVSTKQEVLVFNAKVGFIDNIEAINDIYCLSYNVEKSTANLLIINSEGRVSQLAINDDDTISTLVLDLSSSGQKLNSSSIIKFDNNTSQKSPTFGLVVCIHEGKHSSFKIYELITAPRNGLRAEEINSFSKEFFKNIKPKNDIGVFQAIKWYTTDTNSPVNSNTQSPSQLKKLHKNTDSKDSSLTPYKLLLKLDQTVFSFNIVSKQYELITNYCNSTFDHNLEANDPAVVLTNPIDDSSYQIEIHNFTTPKDPNFVTIEKELNGVIYFAVDNLVVEVSGHNLNIYNYSFELLDSFSITSENSFRIGHYFGILNGSNLILYSLSTKKLI